MPQDDGTTIPFDISVTACIPSVDHHLLLFMRQHVFMRQHGIDLVDTRFSYSVKYGVRPDNYEITYIMHNHWHCGAHTLVNNQETCFVTGLVTARQMGADYPFEDPEARKWFNFYERTMYGWRFRRA